VFDNVVSSYDVEFSTMMLAHLLKSAVEDVQSVGLGSVGGVRPRFDTGFDRAGVLAAIAAMRQ
jgi:hypothetical protein